MAPDERDQGRKRRGACSPFIQRSISGSGSASSFLEQRQAALSKCRKLRVGETPEHQIHFLRAAMMRTVKRAFHAGLDGCHGKIALMRLVDVRNGQRAAMAG